jgi:hypothetical protein
MEARIAPAPYDPYAPLFERVAWCAFNRNQDEWLEQLRKQEQAAKETLDALEAEIKAGGRASAPGASRTGQVYRRVASDKVGATVWKWNARDPVIVEPANGEAQGYIGLVQCWLTKSKQERIDWVPWHDPLNIAPGYVEDWLRTAQRRGLGLMLYPLDPLQRARMKGEDR